MIKIVTLDLYHDTPEKNAKALTRLAREGWKLITVVRGHDDRTHFAYLSKR